MKSVIASLLAILTVVMGCDSEKPKPLCDSDPATGRVALENRAAPERLARGQAVLYDNGAYYLFVDGQCNYWVTNPSQVWEETRTGVLDVEAAARLGDTLHFNAWDDVSGLWSDPRGGVFDAPVLVFDHAEHAVVCVQLCDAPDVPAAVKAMRDAFPVVADELWRSGASAVSSVRAIAVVTEPFQGIPFVDWPLTRPITDFVRADQSIGFGEGILENDDASVRALKDLRASFLRGDHGAFVWGTLPVKSDGTYYQLYVRDTLPFEDDKGLVSLTVDLDSL